MSQDLVAKRILIVDDEPHLLYSLAEYFRHMGYDVTVAESGASALERIIERPPELIISDVLMEGMDGFEFQRRVGALTGYSIPFIFLTAKADVRARIEGLRAGADDYIIKPFEPDELEARVATVLSRVEQTRREERREVELLRSRILAEISRELRAPVSSIMAHLNLLLTQRFGDDQTRIGRYLGEAMGDANVLRELVEDLSWAAADSLGELILKREPLRVAPIVRGSAANAARLANQKAITLKISCGGLLTANMDGEAMSRALAGLLETAVAVSPHGSHVRIAASRAQEGGVEFVITDGGTAPSGQRSSIENDVPAESLDFARRVIKGHGGRFGVCRSEDGAQSMIVWIPGRVARHVGRRQ